MIESGNNGIRHAGWADHALVACYVKSRKSRLGDSGYIGQTEKPARTGQRDRAEFSIADEFDKRRRRIGDEVETLTEEIGDGCCSAPIGNVLQSYVRHACEQLDRKMLQRSDPCRFVLNRVVLRPGLAEEIR